VNRRIFGMSRELPWMDMECRLKMLLAMIVEEINAETKFILMEIL
jgi:hypothetical protein